MPITINAKELLALKKLLLINETMRQSVDHAAAQEIGGLIDALRDVIQRAEGKTAGTIQ